MFNIYDLLLEADKTKKPEEEPQEDEVVDDEEAPDLDSVHKKKIDHYEGADIDENEELSEEDPEKEDEPDDSAELPPDDEEGVPEDDSIETDTEGAEEGTELGSGDEDAELGDEEEPQEDANPSAKYKMKQLMIKYTELYNIMQEILETIPKLDKGDEVEFVTLVTAQKELVKTRDAIYDYILNLFTGKTYEENLYNFYKFELSVKIFNEIIKKLNDLRLQN